MPWRPDWAREPHGTSARYQRHRYEEGAPVKCKLCREAHARDMRFRREMLRRAGWTWSKALNRYVPPAAVSRA